MLRPTLALVVTLGSLALNTAQGDDTLPALPPGNGAENLELPPVLPPNEQTDLALSNPQPGLSGSPLATSTSGLSQEAGPLPGGPPQPEPTLPQGVDPQLGSVDPRALPPGAPAAPLTGPAPELVADPALLAEPAYFSPRLGARFQVQQMSLPQFGGFWGARIVSQPAAHSPLAQLGLGQGDIITRLDGLPLTCELALEQHIFETGVRFIRAGEQTVCQGVMFVHPGMYFMDPAAPACPLGTGCQGLVLRP